MRDQLLEKLAEALREGGYQPEMATLTEGMEVHGLLVPLNDEPDLRLVIYFIGDLMRAAEKSAGRAESTDDVLGENADFLQLFVHLPFEVEEKTYADLARLILMLNWSTAVGTFGLHETQKMVYYRHVFEYLGEDIDPAVFVDTVGGMAHYAAQNFDLLKVVATGESSLAQVLDKLEAEQRREEVFPGYDL